MQAYIPACICQAPQNAFYLPEKEKEQKFKIIKNMFFFFTFLKHNAKLHYDKLPQLR
jgi:hypothetical protein